MKLKHTGGLILGALMALALVPVGYLNTAPEPTTAVTDWRENWAYTVGMQTVVYGYMRVDVDFALTPSERTDI
jgi:hypothetical protein